MDFLKKKSFILKVAIFATGFAGIVAEYILSTLATYFIGNAVFQWTMIVSLMLFCMGLGSRISKLIKKNLIQNFLLLEISLSIVVAFSSITVYSVAAFSEFYGLLIYVISMLVGLLIGLEIPLVIRINNAYDDLKTNISSILEKDYYGSLLGGVFFAFVGLPILGLSYTPFVLGFINFAVAFMVFLKFRNKLNQKGQGNRMFVLLLNVAVILCLGIIYCQPIIEWGEQKKYKDKVVYTEQTKYQKIVLTEWKDEHWLYLNGNLQFCSIDEAMYHEPLVHPVMQLAQHPKEVLILGGGDGCAVRELLKYPSINRIDLVDLDPSMTQLGKSNPILVQINEGAMNSNKLHIYNEDAYLFLTEKERRFYDVIIVDLPDPRSVELNRLYSHEFYSHCYRRLSSGGLLITQAGSPYFATKAYKCIEKTMASANLKTVAMHNQVLSMGEWGWIIGAKTNRATSDAILKRLQSLDFEGINTKWITKEAMLLLTSFGKDNFFMKDNEDAIRINRIHDPVLYEYYQKGNWDLY